MTTGDPTRATSDPRVWDLSLRIWHWLFAAAVSFSLVDRIVRTI